MGALIFFFQLFKRGVRVDLRGGEALVAQQAAYGLDVGAVIEHGGGEGVAQDMGRALLHGGDERELIVDYFAHFGA